MTWRGSLSLVLFIAVVAGVTWHISRYWESIDWSIRIDGDLAAASLACGAATMLMWVLQMQWLLARQGYQLSLSRTVPLVAFPYLAKYVPGKVWGVLYTVHLCVREGIPAVVASVCTFSTMLYGMLGALVIAVLGGAEAPGLHRLSLAAVLVLVLAGLVLAGPAVQALRRMSRPMWEQIPALEMLERHLWWERLGLTLLNIAAWGIYGVGFYLLVSRTMELTWGSLPEFVVVFAVSHIAGMLAFFAPGGIGVREAVAVVGYQSLMPPESAIMIAVVGRIWETLIEIAFAVVGGILTVLSGSPPRAPIPEDPYADEQPTAPEPTSR